MIRIHFMNEPKLLHASMVLQTLPAELSSFLGSLVCVEHF
ncbi:hypothetical protein SORBI_3001G058000 [Sorghum bicolor]|nr:hypothetical protein SORBI_3001G058000 [Sorghum bicolor]